jgi:hypothetical protein
MYGDRNALPEQGDLINFSTPALFAQVRGLCVCKSLLIDFFFNKPMIQGLTGYMAQLDQVMLEGLNKAGFKTNLGVNDTGIGGSVCSLAPQGVFEY